MAKMTIVVKNKAAQTVNIISETGSSEVGSCFQEFEAEVIVPAGQTRYIIIDYVGVGTGSNYANTINTTTIFAVRLEGSINADPLLNNEFSSGVLRVKLNSTSQDLFIKQIVRTHTGNIC